ncbi:hypothetical protein T484DRAFT_1911580 [Baffinella frigidus]|nr:hypothetical protein T484DRAFT_1911580 [Cryptophyta sp. CCMP2293]
MLRKDRPDVDEYGDQAFVLRLPAHMAGRVREMVRANDVNGLELRIDSGRDGGGRPPAFKGRTGSFTIGAGTDAEVVLPASLMHIPTMVECYRTVDGRTGDYIKCADISQIMVAHESEEAALQARADHPSARADSGLTPPTRGVVRREFMRVRPHLSNILKQRKSLPRSAVMRAENHILRMRNLAGDGSDVEFEEVEVEMEDGGEGGDADHDRMVGGGIPYTGKDGALYYQKNGVVFQHGTHQRLGFLPRRVKFTLNHPAKGRMLVAKCDIPHLMRP